MTTIALPNLRKLRFAEDILVKLYSRQDAGSSKRRIGDSGVEVAGPSPVSRTDEPEGRFATRLSVPQHFGGQALGPQSRLGHAHTTFNASECLVHLRHKHCAGWTS
jgi:hypothetical protein